MLTRANTANHWRGDKTTGKSLLWRGARADNATADAQWENEQMQIVTHFSTMRPTKINCIRARGCNCTEYYAGGRSDGIINIGRNVILSIANDGSQGFL